MSITADCHLHSSFSGDSQTPMEKMVKQGIAQGLDTMCFTEHLDYDYPDSPEAPGSMFLLNTDSYLYQLARLKGDYSDKIRLLFGVGAWAAASPRLAKYRIRQLLPLRLYYRFLPCLQRKRPLLSCLF